MASPAVDIASAIDSLLERKEKLHKAFSELESKKAVLTKLGANWKDVEAYLMEVEKRLRNSVQEIASKESALEDKMKESSESLGKRAADVSSREEASLARVQEQKDAAIAVICELQSKHEAAKKEETSKEEESSSEDDENATDEASPDENVNAANASPSQTADVAAKPAAENGSQPRSDHTLSLSSLIAKEASAPASNAGDVKPRAQLKSLCEAMEADKLRNFIADNRKDLNAISTELPFALKLAEQPAQLVLNALEGYSSPDQSASHSNKKDVSMLSNKRACVIMLEALAEVLADPVGGVDHPIVLEDLKKSAKDIADSWKSNINLDGDITSNVSTDAQSFLQLLATFGLASEYDQDELCKLIVPIARRKQTPSLCRSLDLSSKVPDIIEGLIKDGKQMEAITFATEFDLLERFQPVPLLKAYLKDARKAVQNTLKGGNNTAASQNDANQKELSALKVVLKAICELKLEESYPPGPLEKRVAQLEKAKADRKRSAASGKPQQMKRPRTNSSGAAASGMGHEKSYYRSDNRAQYGDSMLPYGAASQPVYERHALGGYSTYGAASRSPVSLQSSYLYSSDGLGSLGYGASAYSATPSATYSGYGYGTGLPSSYPSYH
ncbi:hypothetical protein GOP47_0005399 [Adiantum capillus-veneris]|uniref:FRIGIDA-like protein n=1 Tax=Adiantum capillus-veneris TaxID=13818 RepID=A0A9D4V509_ADICA|nr:hypothetical protein GOP47_0005399 [Adiantum capillus-veneris]